MFLGLGSLTLSFNGNTTNSVTLSSLFVNAGINTFEKIQNTNPREIELFLNRNPPFGSIIVDSVKHLPKYDFEAEQTFASTTDSVTVSVAVFVINVSDLEKKRTTHDRHGCYLIIGDADNNVIVNKKIRDHELIEKGRWIKNFDVPKAQRDELHIHLISDSYVGLDVHKSFTILYNSPLFKNNFFGKEVKPTNGEKNTPTITAEGRRTCNHRCLDKAACAHPCCKTGVNLPKKSNFESFFDQLHNKMNSFPSKKVKIDISRVDRESNEAKVSSVFDEDMKKAQEQKAATFGEQDTLNDEWNDYIEECFTPAFDEKWDDEDAWDDATDNIETKPMEKEIHLATKISFDLNFDDSNDIDGMVEVQNCNDAGEKATFTSEVTNPLGLESKLTDVIDTSFKREVWPKEKYNDPAAWDELLEKVVKHLMNY